MSDNWIILIPEDPHHVPDQSRQEEAVCHFYSLAPDMDEDGLRVSERLLFFDCGANLQSIVCPHCGGEVSVDWWQEQIEDGYDEEFLSMRAYAVPCCGKAVTMADLKYDWPQGFARFGIEAMNPNIGELPAEEKARFEEILGVPLRVIYRHL